MNNRNIDPRRTEQLAYKLWEDAGRPDGAHEQHWRDAEDQLIREAEESGSYGRHGDATGLDGDVAALDGDAARQQTGRQASRSRNR